MTVKLGGSSMVIHRRINSRFERSRVPVNGANGFPFIASTLLTSNRPVEDWGKLSGDSAAESYSCKSVRGAFPQQP